MADVNKEGVFRKVYISIRTKLSVLISILLLLSLTFYVFYAIDLFKKDKSAFIFETSLLHVKSLVNQYEVTLNYLHDQMLAMDQIFSRSENKVGQNIFNKNSLIFEFASFQKNGDGYKQLLGIKDVNNQEEKIALAQNKTLIQLLDNVQKRGFSYITYFKNGRGELMVGSLNKDGSRLLLVRAYLDDLIRGTNRDEHYKSILVGENLTYLQHPQGEMLQHKISSSYQNFIKELNSEKIDQGVKRSTLDGVSYLIAFKKLTHYGAWALVLIDENRAFQATAYLVKKSLLFGVFILSVALIVGMLFSKGITSPIEVLFEATKNFASGNFVQNIKIKAHDELGVLADSFNYMSHEIVRYMNEMKEKLRLEKEVEVAKLVQESFFPPSCSQHGNSEIAAFYKPATECGGDWWAEIEQDDKTVLIIADATGHGVPAALLTATLHSCITTLKEISKIGQSQLQSPELILDFLNKAVCETSEKMLVTCFVVVIDHDKKTLSYANASHNPPLICRYSDNISKSSFESMLCESGPHLGKDNSYRYKSKEIEYKQNDRIVLYTDGIVEGLNPDNKQWGSRRMLKALVEHIQLPATKTVENTIDDAFGFYEGRMNDDDITFVVARLG